MKNRYAIAVVIALGALACNDRRPAETATNPVALAPITTTTASPTEKQCVPGKDVLCPIDEGAHDPSFATYRQQLIAAIDKRNAAELLPLADDHIRTTFGGGGDRAAFERQLQKSESPLWNELSQAVRLGGSFKGPAGTDRSFWAPYVYANWPEEIDAFTHVAAIRADVALRDHPSADGEVLRSLDWSILEVIDSKDPAWRHVRTSDKTSGWVSASDVRSPIGYRAGFNQIAGQWKMTAFVAGD
jgi:hypothetical protein